jgi:hypothetical protein
MPLFVILAKAGIQPKQRLSWISAFAGMTKRGRKKLFSSLLGVRLAHIPADQ